jgi:RNA polymerase-interacting CarD/CdnL/TRCF family regulator
MKTKPTNNQKLKSSYIAAIREVLEDLSMDDETDDCYLLSVDKKIYERYQNIIAKALDANVTWYQ